MTKTGFSLIFIAVLIFQLLLGPADGHFLEAGGLALEERHPAVSAPERDRLNMVSFLPVRIDGITVARLAAYDDATTRRAADYLKIYDNEGHLLGFGWFDRFGIERTAIDRGLLEGRVELEGVFIVIADGDSV